MNWQEVCESPYLKGLPFKFELNGYGQILATPLENSHSILKGLPFKFELNGYGQILATPLENSHSILKGKIIHKLNELAKKSEVNEKFCQFITDFYAESILS